MKLLQLLQSKFSIFLTLTMTFMALAATASAQDKFYQTKNPFATNFPIYSMNSSKSDSVIPNDDVFFGNSSSAFVKKSADGRHTGGVLVVFGDGSVRFTVEVSEVYLPNSPLDFDRVDAQDPNAALKIGMLFDAALRMESGFVITVQAGSVTVPARFRAAKLTIGKGTSRMEIKMQDVLVTSYSISSVSSRERTEDKAGSVDSDNAYKSSPKLMLFCARGSY